MGGEREIRLNDKLRETMREKVREKEKERMRESGSEREREIGLSDIVVLPPTIFRL